MLGKGTTGGVPRTSALPAVRGFPGPALQSTHGFTQSLAATLDDVTVAAAQNLQHVELGAKIGMVLGPLGPTYVSGGLSLAEGALVVSPAEQRLAATLDSVTVAASQARKRSQALAATLDSVTVAIAQAQKRSQALAATLDSVTVAASQAQKRSQALAATLADITAAIAQALSHVQALAATLDGVTVAASQTTKHAQTLAATLDGIAVAISQSPPIVIHDQTLAAMLAGIAVAVDQTFVHEQHLAIILAGVTVAVEQHRLGPLFPLPEQVAAGIVYGPTGEDYIGTRTGGSAYLRRR